jgi:hypothetical protein|uniref:Uncharacterized protein n=1 Tax=Bionectria ochroleuca TaxID=29856 RepID=A0A8H7KFT6_BIOOC
MTLIEQMPPRFNIGRICREPAEVPDAVVDGATDVDPSPNPNVVLEVAVRLSIEIGVIAAWLPGTLVEVDDVVGVGFDVGVADDDVTVLNLVFVVIDVSLDVEVGSGTETEE